MALRNPVSMFKSKSAGGVAERRVLPTELAQQVARQCSNWDIARLSSCTFVRLGSSYPDCKAEIEIYGPDGALVVRGREFRSGAPLYWIV